MSSWLRGLALALVFALVGAFATSVWLEIRRETPKALGPLPGRWQGRRIRVEVLNGAGVPQLAKRTTDRLRELEFDVVYYGNAPDRDSSLAIARLDSIEPARRVADALGLHEVVHRPDRNLYLDVTVILGADWADVVEAPEEEAPGRFTVWWARIKRAALRLWPG
ncbi:MAG: LytR C-terminal domain-containing protein [Gemmatimonadota bacterium]